jgi:TonB family protein
LRRACLILLALPFLFQPALRGQDPANLSARLQAADAASALDVAGMKPWHLKMTVQLFDPNGHISDEATVEEWWNSPELDRREYKAKGYTATEIRSGGKIYRTKGVDVPPYLLELLRRQVVHPLSLAETMQADLKNLNVAKIALDCIQLRTAQEKGPGALGTSRAYCLDAGSNSLRMTLDHTIQQIVRERIGEFQGKQVAAGAVVSGNGFKLAAEHIDSLSAGAAPDSQFAVSADTLVVVPRLLSSEDPSMSVGAPIFRRGPVFPVLAKTQHVESGTVVVRAIVGINGKVRSAAVVASANSVFDDAAMDAVRQWRYQPSTVDGQPAELEAVIVVNFFSS